MPKNYQRLEPRSYQFCQWASPDHLEIIVICPADCRAVFSKGREMALRKTEYLNEIFRLLSEQRELLEHPPYSSKQVKKDKKISACIRELVDQILIEQSTATKAVTSGPETWSGEETMKLRIRNPHGRSCLRLLTARQREVVRVLAEGKTMREAASILGVTPRTVAFHKYRVMRALDLHTRADLIIFAVKSHIVKLRA